MTPVVKKKNQTFFIVLVFVPLFLGAASETAATVAAAAAAAGSVVVLLLIPFGPDLIHDITWCRGFCPCAVAVADLYCTFLTSQGRETHQTRVWTGGNESC